MSWFYNLKIAHKILLVFFINILVLSGISIVYLIELQNVNQSSINIVNNWLPSVKSLGDIKLSLSRIRSSQFRHIATDDPDISTTIEKDILNKITILKDQQQIYSNLISSGTEMKAYAALSLSIENFYQVNDKTILLSKVGNKKEALNYLVMTSSSTYFNILTDIEHLTEINNQGAIESSKKVESIYSRAKTLIICLVLGTIIYSTVISIWLSYMISSPFNLAVSLAKKISSGDLTSRIEPSSFKDESGELITSLNLMNHHLSNIVTQVNSKSIILNKSATAISSGNLDLSKRTYNEITSLTNTLACIKSISKNVEQNYDKIQRTQNVGSLVSQFVSEHIVKSKEITSNIEQLEQDNEKLSYVFNLIDNFNHQLNILSLHSQDSDVISIPKNEFKQLMEVGNNLSKDIKIVQHSYFSNISLILSQSKTLSHENITLSNYIQRINNKADYLYLNTKEQIDSLQSIFKLLLNLENEILENAEIVNIVASASNTLKNNAHQLSETVSSFKFK